MFRTPDYTQSHGQPKAMIPIRTLSTMKAEPGDQAFLRGKKHHPVERVKSRFPDLGLSAIGMGVNFSPRLELK